jgi:ATP-dependent DNA helicase RecQ
MADPEDLPERVRETAASVFGHQQLLPGQERAMRALLEGHDVLLVSPTGSAKSLTYQVPAVLLAGPTVVLSPLLALQRDQIDALGDTGEDTEGARISSAESRRQRERAFRSVAAGETEFLFLSPEQLANEEVAAEVAALRPSLVAVDEAHCVSSWGHDFRPDYLRTGELIDRLDRPRVIALTATAAPPVREDVVARLGLRDARVVVTGVERPNIRLDVVRSPTADAQRAAVLDTVRDTPGPGIVYCRTRRSTEEYAAALEESGVRVAAYHAGMPERRRQETQEAFMRGQVDVICATSAFGMGIDKHDVRFVFHAQVPESPDTYYQEVGRAGRDGLDAAGTLFYRPEDLSLGRFFTSPVPAADDVAAVAEALAEQPGASRASLREAVGQGPRKLGRILNLLADAERSGADPDDRATLVATAVQRAEACQKLEQSRVEMMRGYAETRRCRHQYLVGYFGEETEDLCGHCDNCDGGAAEAEAAAMPARAPYPLQSTVRHEQLGNGTVMDLEPGKVTVLFDEVGYRTLDLALVEEQGLLEPTGPAHDAAEAG